MTPPPEGAGAGSTRIRAARADELELIRAIERAAGQRFADVGLADVAADEPMAVEVLAAHREAGGLWVAADPDDGLVGFAAAHRLDGGVHLDELAVHPDAQGCGVGTQLVERVGRWAATDGGSAVTLTTFRDVPWNRPFYERRGFQVLAEDELTPGLVAVRAEEAAHGLDPAARVCMRRDLP